MCCCCGVLGNDLHYLVGHGGTGTKAGNFNVMLLCRVFHAVLHDKVAVWE
ncbi:DUF968 domain-containing protein [Citrobacter freundii]